MVLTGCQALNEIELPCIFLCRGMVPVGPFQIMYGPTVCACPKAKPDAASWRSASRVPESKIHSRYTLRPQGNQ